MSSVFTVAEPFDKSMVRKRKRWLKRQMMTVRDFSDVVDIDYNTVIRWINIGRAPMKPYAKAIKKKFKTFPL